MLPGSTKSLQADAVSGAPGPGALSSIFNYGIELDWIASNPAKVKGIKFEEAKRERWLTVEELQKFREALDKYKDQSAANLGFFSMLTGSRASEALKARWEEFDLQRGVWTKPSHHTKQKKVEHVPLSAPALKLLEGMYLQKALTAAVPRQSAQGQSLRRACLAQTSVDRCVPCSRAHRRVPYRRQAQRRGWRACEAQTLPAHGASARSAA